MLNFAANLNKMINAGLGGPLDPPRTEVAVGHRVVYTEASGAMASFETNVIAPVKNLRVTMEPIQDLHGYDHPWPAGGGKNVFDEDTVYAAYKQADGSFILSGTQGNYTRAPIPANYIGTPMTFSAIMRIPEGSTITNVRVGARINGVSKPGNPINDGTYALSSVTFTPETAEDYVFLSFGANGSSNMQAKDIQLEVSSSATDYIPYSNICPITGRDVVNIYQESTYDPGAAPAVTVALSQTVYGGTLVVSSGICHSLWANIPSYAGEDLPGEWISDRDVYAPGAVPTIGAQVVYKREIADMIILTPAQLNTLAGENNVWSDAGNISLEYPCYEETEGY